MKRIITFAACLAVVTPALGQSITEKTGVNSLLGIAPKSSDFVSEAAMGDMYEIEAGRLAADRGDAATKAFATQMISDHEKTATSLKALVVSGAIKETLPTDLDSTHQDMLQTLKGLNGAEFTTRYDSDQVTAHKEAVSLFQRYGKGGDNDALKAWANQTLPELQHHLDMAVALRK